MHISFLQMPALFLQELFPWGLAYPLSIYNPQAFASPALSISYTAIPTSYFYELVVETLYEAMN